MSAEEEDAEGRARAWEERRQIVEKYDLGREKGALIDEWEDLTLEVYHKKDRFGFIHDERLPDLGTSEREKKQNEKEMSRADKWLKMIKEPKKFFPAHAKHRDVMVGRVWKGVPQRVRGEFWRLLLDIDTTKKEQEGVYSKMKDLARRHSPDIRQIDLDVNRTYRNHDMFRERYNVRQQDLFHVLAAYSMYNTEVGYCQGMSQIAALLLMYLLSEEDAFWALHKLMIGPLYRMHGFFIPQFPKLIRFQDHFEKILTKKLPRLHKHLVKNGVESGIYTLKWFFQCFLDRLPYSLGIRVWDLYLLEGEPIMFAMAYSILKLHRQRMLKMGMDDLLELLQKTLEANFGYDDDFVIETALRQNLQELRSSRLHTAGEAPAKELPEKPFGLERVPTVEEELGHRQPCTEEEIRFSQYAIQRELETVRRLQHLDSQTSIDQSLNETGTGSAEPETEDLNSVEQDSILNSPSRSRTNSLSQRSRSRTGSPPPSVAIIPPAGAERVLRPGLPPSPLPQSREQDVLDDSVIYLMREAGLGPLHPRPASADPRSPSQQPLHTQDIHKRNSAHVGGNGSGEFGWTAQPVTPLRPPASILPAASGGLDTSQGSSASTNSSVEGAGASSRRPASSRGLEERSARPTHYPGGNGRRRENRVSDPSGSRQRSGSRGSYYYGENPRDLLNGHEAAKLEDDILNLSFESAAPHKGESVLIRVGGRGSPQVPDIERHAKEISPRFDGHKVIIQLNKPATHDSGPTHQLFSTPPSNTFQSHPVSAHQVSKHLVSTSERKLSSQGEVYRSTHSMFLNEQSEHRASRQDPVTRSVQSSRYYKETRRVDGAVVERQEEFQQVRDPHQGNGLNGDGMARSKRSHRVSRPDYSPLREPAEQIPPRLAHSPVRDLRDFSAARPTETFF